jgi:hypothetical protein
MNHQKIGKGTEEEHQAKKRSDLFGERLHPVMLRHLI